MSIVQEVFTLFKNNKEKLYHKIIYLFEKEMSSEPKFSQVRSSVSAEYLKRKDDQSLREYLENLKRSKNVEFKSNP